MLPVLPLSSSLTLSLRQPGTGSRDRELETAIRDREPKPGPCGTEQLIVKGFEAWSHAVQIQMQTQIQIQIRIQIQKQIQIQSGKASRELRVGQITSVSFSSGGVDAATSGVKGVRRMNTVPLTPAAAASCGGCMNDTEVTMSESQPTRDFHAHSTALKAAQIVLELARRVPAPYRSLADQVIRSATSVPANLAEDNGRAGKDRFYHWRIAYASALEVDTHLTLLNSAGVVDAAAVQEAAQLFDQVRAMTWRLLHKKK